MTPQREALARGAAGVVPFHRPPRMLPEPLADDPVVVAAPPSSSPPSGRSFLQVLLPVAGSIGFLGFALIAGNRLFLAIAGGTVALMIVASIGIQAGQRRAAARQRRQRAERYRAYLDRQRRRLEALAAAQRDLAARLHPYPERLRSLVTTREHLWERRREDPDFLQVRIGLEDAPLAVPIRLDLSDDPLVEYEQELLTEASELVDGYRRLPHLPATMPMAALGSVGVVGDPDAAHGLVRAIVCQLSVWHAPDDLRLLAWSDPGNAPAWEWMKWLPHTGEPGSDPRHGVALTTDVDDLGVLLTQLVKPRLEHLERTRAGEHHPIDRGTAVPFQRAVVIVDGYDPLGPVGRLQLLERLLGCAADIGVLVITLAAHGRDLPSEAGAVLEATGDGRLRYLEPGKRERWLRADLPPVESCETVARAMTPVLLRTRQGRSTTVDSGSLLDLLGLASVDQFPTSRPDAATTPEALLRTPIGIADDGSPLLLDLKEAAEGGMGPHGLLVGATGSGKSELLRTLVTGLALTHAPEQLAVILVDFKGGATFAELTALPHVAGVITNLERDLTMVDRMREALFGELERRQRALQKAGNFDRVRDYQAHRAANPAADLAPLPSLLVIVDEFGELLAARPDFLDLFTSIGRTGRSLSVHLLLASQRLDEGRLCGLDGHLRYRLCLRTFSPEESLVTLGSRAAFELPPLPGLGYVRVDGGVQRFKAALATRPYRQQRAFAEENGVVRAFGIGGPGAELAVVGGRSRPQRPSRQATGGDGQARLRSEMQVSVQELSRTTPPGRRVRQVWLPPLPVAITLDAVAERAETTTADPGTADWLKLLLGVLDRPRDQTQAPFAVDLTGGGGHLAVVGAPRSGKSTLLQTLIAGLALTHDPSDAHVYAVDLGGGGLHALAAAPHVGAVYGRADRQGVGRLVRKLRTVVEERGASFRRHGLDGMLAYHQARRAGKLPDAGCGEVFLVIDNWALFAAEFADLVDDVQTLAASGLHYGVHLIIASNRWNDLRIALRDNLGGRLELRLNDPYESEIDRHGARALPEDVPGRGLSSAGQQFQAALPRLDGLAEAGSLRLGIERLLETVAARWADASPAPPIRTLPDEVHATDLPEEVGDHQPGVAIGLEEVDLRPVRMDLFGSDPHFLVLGDDRCGKTTLLGGWMRRMTARYPPEQVRVAVVDYRRQLLDTVDEQRLLGYAYTPPMARELADRLAADLASRLPGPDLPAEALRRPRTWSGPRLVLVVDDYDLLVGAQGSPLAAVVELLAHGADIGFHLLLARRVAGFARSSFEPLLQRLRELNPSGLLMSGDPQEGPLLGGRKAEPLPPGRGYLIKGRAAVLVQTVRAAAGRQPGRPDPVQPGLPGR
jgi:S-DNA-T family DNA segregation ATPase FtsK/SpoIIIE